MNLNDIECRQRKIISELEKHLQIDGNLNMLCSLRNRLEESLKQVYELIEEADKETFKENIMKCPIWYDSKVKIRVKIEKIDWDKEVLYWHKDDGKYPNGSCTFEYFRGSCYPLWM